MQKRKKIEKTPKYEQFPSEIKFQSTIIYYPFLANHLSCI